MGMAKPTSAARRPAGHLQSLRNGAAARISSAKPRIVYTYSPKVYKIKPEEFLALVQKLTGRNDTSQTSTRVRAQADSVNMITSSSHQSGSHVEAECSVTTLADRTPASTHQLLESLPSPRFVTMNFLPMLAAASPSAFNQSRMIRDVG